MGEKKEYWVVLYPINKYDPYSAKKKAFFLFSSNMHSCSFFFVYINKKKKNSQLSVVWPEHAIWQEYLFNFSVYPVNIRKISNNYFCWWFFFFWVNTLMSWFINLAIYEWYVCGNQEKLSVRRKLFYSFRWWHNIRTTKRQKRIITPSLVFLFNSETK